MIIYIKPIALTRIHKEHPEFGGERSYKANLDVNRNKYDIQFSEEDIAFFKENDREDVLETYYERDGKENKLWSKYTLNLPFTNILLDTDNVRERIDYIVAKTCKNVANSKKEFDEGKFPYAKYYIHNTEEENKVRSKKINILIQKIKYYLLYIFKM